MVAPLWNWKAESKTPLFDGVAEGVHSHVEQQWGQSIFLVDTALDVNLCNWL